MKSTGSSCTNIRVCVLEYNEEKRCFSTCPIYRRSTARNNDNADDGSLLVEHVLSIEETESLGIFPSSSWIEDYNQWNVFEENRWRNFQDVDDEDDDDEKSNSLSSSSGSFNDHHHGGGGYPKFATISDLNKFNAKGQELVDRLRQELTDHDYHGNVVTVTVDEYQPLYKSIEVSDSVSGWWHVKDKLYHCIVPIQNLPISDDLKSRLMFWRKCKDENWLDEESRRSSRDEGHDLEEHILWELNVRFDDLMNNNKKKKKHGRSDSSNEKTYSSTHSSKDASVDSLLGTTTTTGLMKMDNNAAAVVVAK